MRTILFLSHTYWGSTFRIGSHHLSECMARSGNKVLYLPVPISPFHLAKPSNYVNRIKLSGRANDIIPNLTQLILRTPLPAGELISKNGNDLAFACSKDILARTLKRLNIKRFDVAFIDHPKLFGLSKLLEIDQLIYRPTDILSGIGLRGYYRAEKLVLDHSDALVCTSKPVLEHLKGRFSFDLPALVQVNGVNLANFRSPQPEPLDLGHIPHPRCIYVGAFDDRFDFDGTFHLALEHRDLQFVLIGPTSRANKRLSALKNVHFLGERPFEQVPAYMQACDVALMPFSDHPSNVGRSPMKLYEFLAAGLPVVAKNTPEIARRGDRNVYIYNTVREASALISTALSSTEFRFELPRDLDWGSISDRILAFSDSCKRVTHDHN